MILDAKVWKLSIKLQLTLADDNVNIFKKKKATHLWRY